MVEVTVKPENGAYHEDCALCFGKGNVITGIYGNFTAGATITQSSERDGVGGAGAWVMRSHMARPTHKLRG